MDILFRELCQPCSFKVTERSLEGGCTQEINSLDLQLSDTKNYLHRYCGNLSMCPRINTRYRVRIHSAILEIHHKIKRWTDHLTFQVAYGNEIYQKKSKWGHQHAEGKFFAVCSPITKVQPKHWKAFRCR